MLCPGWRSAGCLNRRTGIVCPEQIYNCLAIIIQVKFVTDYSQHREQTGWLQILCISLLGTVKAEEKFNMSRVKTLYKSSNMDCLLQNLTLFLLLLQPQSATDELIPPAPEKNSWGFRKGSGWMKCIHRDGTAIIRGLTIYHPPWYFTAVKNKQEYKWIFIIPPKVECFPKNLFQLHKFMPGLLTWGEGTCLDKFSLPPAGTSCPIYYPCVFPAGWRFGFLLLNSSFLEVQWVSTHTSAFTDEFIAHFHL